MGKEYLVEGAKLKCIHGSKVILLKVPEHGRALRYGFARGGATEQKTAGASGSCIGGLVSCLKYSR